MCCPLSRRRKSSAYIRNLFDSIGTPQGGIIACGEIIEDVPLANIAAMYEAFLEYRYQQGEPKAALG